jgi:hypothetical protein
MQVILLFMVHICCIFIHIIKVDNAKDAKKISRKELKKQQKKLEYENELKALGSKLHEQSLDNASTTKG